MIRSVLFLLAARLAAVDAEARTSPPSGAVVVDASGQNGDYTTVQAGVESLSTTESGTQTSFIYPGIYIEQVASLHAAFEARLLFDG